MSNRRMCSRSWASLVASAAVLALASPRARAQEVVRQWFGDYAGQQLGDSIRRVGDVNADGFVDVAISAPLDSTTFTNAGMLRVVSGADGAVLQSWYGDRAYAGLGQIGDPIGDLDGDGFDDVLTSEPRGAALGLGRVFVFSGKDGSTLLQMDGSFSYFLTGRICGIGDIDGDAVPDFAAGDGHAVRLFSGATGSVIRLLQSAGNLGDTFGAALANAGDLDGDLVPDLLVTETGCTFNPSEVCYAFSGATGAGIWQCTLGNCHSGSGYIELGRVLRVVGDVNGDGVPDWCVAGNSRNNSGYSFNNYGTAQCFSGKDGSFLFDLSEPGYIYRPWNADTDFGNAIAPTADTNGDGVPDIAVTDDIGFDNPGGDVFVFSGVDGSPLFHLGGSANSVKFGIGLEGGFDADRDGRLEFFAGDTRDSTHGASAGAATQFRLRELILDATPHFVTSYGRNMLLTLNGEPPGNPAALFLLGVNGTPMFALLQLGTFDSFRRWWQSISIPYGARGNSVSLRAYALDANGHLVASNDETISFQ